MEVKVLATTGEERRKIEFPEEVFKEKINHGLIWEAVEMYRANLRQGTACTKTKGEVRGGGRKPWRQKHTGRARAGSIRSPIWRGGGIVFGPKPRDYSYTVPDKKRRRALLETVKEKLRKKNLIVVEDFTLPEPKTKLFAQILKNLNLDTQNSILFAFPNHDELLYRAGRNIPNLELMPLSQLNAYAVWKNTKLLFTEKACKGFIEKWKSLNLQK